MDSVKLAATAADISKILEMGQGLFKAVKSPLGVCPVTAGASLSRLIQSPVGIVFITRRGFIAGEIMSTAINPEPIAVEHGWWASDRSGVRLLRAFEVWARENECREIKMSTAYPAGVAGKILEKRGYVAAEITWFKKWV